MNPVSPTAYLLPLCVALTLIGLIATVIAWRAGARKGKVLQLLGLSVLPVGLYLSGLLPVIWNFIAGVISWAGRLIFSPGVWTGLAFIGLAMVLWVIGGIVAKRSRDKSGKGGTDAAAISAASASSPTVRSSPAKSAKQPAGGTSAGNQSTGDFDTDEIEALLRKRGIE